MKSRFLLLALCLAAASARSQQLEIGPNLGLGFSNIVDSKSEVDQDVIGKAFWRPTFGFSTLYYLKGPNDDAHARVGFLFRSSKRGSVSEVNKKDHFEAAANTIGVFGGIGQDVGKGYIVYGDGGFSYSTIKNSSFYRGKRAQTLSFPKLNQDMAIKPNEISFIFAIGVEKNIVPNKLKLLLEVNGDAGISKINRGSGSYRTQSLGFSLGIRSILFPFLEGAN